jgi:hypothetical protein
MTLGLDIEGAKRADLQARLVLYRHLSRSEAVSAEGVAKDQKPEQFPR